MEKRLATDEMIGVRVPMRPLNGDCSVMVSTTDCGSVSQGSSPAVTQMP